MHPAAAQVGMWKYRRWQEIDYGGLVLHGEWK